MKFLFLITLLLIRFPKLITGNECGTKILNLVYQHNEISIRLLYDEVFLLFNDSMIYKYGNGNSHADVITTNFSYEYSGTFIPFVKNSGNGIKYIVSYSNNQIIVYNESFNSYEIGCKQLTAISPINDSDFLVSYKDNNQFQVAYFHLNAEINMHLTNFSNLDINETNIMNVYKLFDNYVYLSFNCSHIESGILSYDEINKTFSIESDSRNILNITKMNDKCEDLKEMQVIQMNDTTVIICLLTSNSKNLFCFKGNFFNNNNKDSDEVKNIFQLNQMCGNLIQCGEHFSIYKYSDDEVMIGCLIKDTEEINKIINMQILSINCITQNVTLDCGDIYVKDFIIYNKKQYYIGMKKNDENIFFISNNISKTEKLYQKINGFNKLNILEDKSVLIRENTCKDLGVENNMINLNNVKINLSELFFNAKFNNSCYFLYLNVNEESDLHKIELISCYKNCHSCITSVNETKMNCITCENDDNYELIYYDGEEVGNCCQKSTDCISYNENCKCILERAFLKDEIYFIDKRTKNTIEINLIPNYSLTNSQRIFIETIIGFKGTIKNTFESVKSSKSGFFIDDVTVHYINNEEKGTFSFQYALYKNDRPISKTATIMIYVCDSNNEYFDNTTQTCINEDEEEMEDNEDEEKMEDNEDEEGEEEEEGKKDIEVEEEEDKEGEHEDIDDREEGIDDEVGKVEEKDKEEEEVNKGQEMEVEDLVEEDEGQIQENEEIVITEEKETEDIKIDDGIEENKNILLNYSSNQEIINNLEDLSIYLANLKETLEDDKYIIQVYYTDDEFVKNSSISYIDFSECESLLKKKG